jgi:hypothetical protein
VDRDRQWNRVPLLCPNLHGRIDDVPEHLFYAWHRSYLLLRGAKLFQPGGSPYRSAPLLNQRLPIIATPKKTCQRTSRGFACCPAHHDHGREPLAHYRLSSAHSARPWADGGCMSNPSCLDTVIRQNAPGLPAEQIGDSNPVSGKRNPQKHPSPAWLDR